MQDAVIVSAARTPIGAINGSLAAIKVPPNHAHPTPTYIPQAPELGSIAVKAAIERAGVLPHDIVLCMYTILLNQELIH